MQVTNLFTNETVSVSPADVYSVTIEHDGWPVILLNDGTYIVTDGRVGWKGILEELGMSDLGVTHDGGRHALER